MSHQKCTTRQSGVWDWLLKVHLYSNSSVKPLLQNSLLSITVDTQGKRHCNKVNVKRRKTFSALKNFVKSNP